MAEPPDSSLSRFARDPRDPPGGHEGQPAARGRVLRGLAACRCATRHDRGPRAGPAEKPGPTELIAPVLSRDTRVGWGVLTARR